MLISIQQPEYFPWIGYFDKMMKVDGIVFLDNVQFKKRYFENRNKIRTDQGWIWIRTPVLTKRKFAQKICEVELDNSQPWQRKLVSTLVRNYKKAPYWNQIGDELCEIIMRPYTLLVDLNLAVIFLLIQKLGISRDCYRASRLGTHHTGSKLIAEICEKVGAAEYLSGRDGRNYLNETDFALKGIKVKYQDFRHPLYTQFQNGFESHMSIIDLYVNHGPDSIEVIKKCNAELIIGEVS